MNTFACKKLLQMHMVNNNPPFFSVHTNKVKTKFWVEVHETAKLMWTHHFLSFQSKYCVELLSVCMAATEATALTVPGDDEDAGRHMAERANSLEQVGCTV